MVSCTLTVSVTNCRIGESWPLRVVQTCDWRVTWCCSRSCVSSGMRLFAGVRAARHKNAQRRQDAGESAHLHPPAQLQFKRGCRAGSCPCGLQFGATLQHQRLPTHPMIPIPGPTRRPHLSIIGRRLPLVLTHTLTRPASLPPSHRPSLIMLGMAAG